MDDDNPQIYWLVQSPNKSLINHHLSLHNHNPQNYIPIVKNSPFRRSSAHVLNHLTMGNIGKSPFRMVKSPPSPSIQPPFPLENNHLRGHWTQKKMSRLATFRHHEPGHVRRRHHLPSLVEFRGLATLGSSWGYRYI